MNEVTAFMYYIYNKWNLAESKNLFGENLGDHIWEKYMQFSDKLYFYAELDNECREKIVNRAKSIYF